MRFNVKCDKGFNHGSGYTVWMHPPVHRILGWITKPSSLKLSLNVWRLNQLKGLEGDIAYVKGSPSISDPGTINRFPTLINANVLNKNGEKIGSIVDFFFEQKSGNILYYLVSRSNPKIPGSSRWSLRIEDIKDQQPGVVLTNLSSIDDLPSLRTSIREDFLQKSKVWRTQIQDIRNQASSNLEGWLEESSDEDKFNYESKSFYDESEVPLDDWIDNNESNSENKVSELLNELEYDSTTYPQKGKDIDPWI